MLVDILTTDTFEHGLSQLSPGMRETAIRKIRLLAENPAHPSLKTHRLKTVKANIWDCYITESMRLLYEIKDKCLHLWELGSHSIVDNVRLRGFAANTRFNRRDDFLPDVLPFILEPEQEKPYFDAVSKNTLPIDTIDVVTGKKVHQIISLVFRMRTCVFWEYQRTSCRL